MLSPGIRSFQEFAVREPLPLFQIHGSILEFIRGRKDAVVFGAHAVNAYVKESRMSQDVDLLSTRAAELASELRDHLHERFHIAVRVKKLDDLAYRLFQSRKSGSRHLADIRQVDQIPKARRISGVAVLAPAELIASRVVAYHGRRGKPKSGVTGGT